jgi:hypothetical protein
MPGMAVVSVHTCRNPGEYSKWRAQVAFASTLEDDPLGDVYFGPVTTIFNTFTEDTTLEAACDTLLVQLRLER